MMEEGPTIDWHALQTRVAQTQLSVHDFQVPSRAEVEQQEISVLTYPNWQDARAELNELPLSAEAWNKRRT
jgi:hypothetical protein